jgi:2-polyprenyl-3-methyl-5-hydroxy-6-metoxy-1,4-benzoquinol methylase
MLIKKHVPKTAKILEISCGRGEIIAKLQKDGYTVKGTNYTKYPEKIDGLDIDYGIDILKGLPDDDNSFGCVILVDVIEHLRDHDKALQEISRVCSMDGYLLILTPNIMKISSRLHFLTTGFFKTKRAFIGYDVPSKSSFAFHNYPPYLPIFLYQLKSHHFKLYLFDAAGFKYKSLILLLIFYPVILIATYFKTHLKEKYIKSSGTSNFLLKIMTSFSALCGEFYIVLAKKQPDTVQTTTKMPSWAQKYD